LGYATSPRGACHLQAYSHGLEAWTPQPELGFPEIVDRFSLERKAELTARMQDLMSMFDSLKLCKFILSPSLSAARIGEWLGMVTGEEFSGDDVLLAGERIFNLKRLFNIREGITGRDDSLPPRVATGPGGQHLKELLQEYYRIRGWDSRGRPRNETLERLGLKELVEE
jgi:aldehyde:ferredoxin oxidoreductase